LAARCLPLDLRKDRGRRGRRTRTALGSPRHPGVVLIEAAVEPIYLECLDLDLRGVTLRVLAALSMVKPVGTQIEMRLYIEEKEVLGYLQLGLIEE